MNFALRSDRPDRPGTPSHGRRSRDAERRRLPPLPLGRPHQGHDCLNDASWQNRATDLQFSPSRVGAALVQPPASRFDASAMSQNDLQNGDWRCNSCDPQLGLATIWQQHWQHHRHVVILLEDKGSHVTAFITERLSVTAMCCQYHDMADFLASGPSGLNSPVQVQVLTSALCRVWALRSVTWTKNQFGVGDFSDFVPDFS